MKNVTPDKPPTQIRLQPLPRAYGRVLDSAGKPVAGATVSLILGGTEVSDSGGRSFSFWSETTTPALATTDPSGRFALPILPELTCWASVRARGYVPGVAAVAREKPVTVRLRRAEHQYAGTVVTPYGDPDAGVKVQAEYRPPGGKDIVPTNYTPSEPMRRILLKEVSTDSQGRFSFSEMPARLRLSVSGKPPDMGVASPVVTPSRDLLIVLARPMWARAEREMVAPKVDLLLAQAEWLEQSPQFAGKQTLLIFTAPYLAQNESLFESLRSLPSDRWQVVTVFDSYYRKEVEQYCKRVLPPGIVGYWKPRTRGALPIPIHEAVPSLPYIVILDGNGQPQRFGVKMVELSRVLNPLP
ncbi:MAG: carboxypeptidase-like regulatory domain-containing protein [Armatimonadota bacterium]